MPSRITLQRSTQSSRRRSSNKVGRLSKMKFRSNIGIAREQLLNYLEKFEIEEKANDGKPIYKLTTPNIKLLCLYLLAVLSIHKADVDKIINLIDMSSYDAEKLGVFSDYLAVCLGDKINIRFQDEEPVNIHEFCNRKSFAIKELCFLYDKSNIEKASRIQTNLNFLISKIFNDNNSRINETFKNHENKQPGYDTYVFRNAFQDTDELDRVTQSSSDLYNINTNSKSKNSNIRYTKQGNKVNIADATIYASVRLGEIKLKHQNSNHRWSASSYSRRSKSTRNSNNSSSYRRSSSNN